LGLFKYQLQFTVKLLISRYGNGPIKNLEECLSQIPRHPNLKVFKNGFDKFKRLTATEYRDLMKIVLFALDGLIPDKKLNKNFIRQLKYCIHDYFLNIENWSLQDIENETILIEAFEHAYLDNDYKVIIRASSNYYGQKAFLDVCVEMDESEQNDYLTDGSLYYAKIYIN
ncbi:1831_t:CDS:2, partial [Racocetra fulgida]